MYRKESGGSLNHNQNDETKSGYENPNYQVRNNMVQFVMNMPPFEDVDQGIVVSTPSILEGNGFI